MKSLLIERVSNGWIVRPFAPSECWASTPTEVSVYSDIAALQEALPLLLKQLERLPTMEKKP